MPSIQRTLAFFGSSSLSPLPASPVAEADDSVPGSPTTATVQGSAKRPGNTPSGNVWENRLRSYFKPKPDTSGPSRTAPTVTLKRKSKTASQENEVKPPLKRAKKAADVTPKQAATSVAAAVAEAVSPAVPDIPVVPITSPAMTVETDVAGSRPQLIPVFSFDIASPIERDPASSKDETGHVRTTEYAPIKGNVSPAHPLSESSSAARVVNLEFSHLEAQTIPDLSWFPDSIGKGKAVQSDQLDARTFLTYWLSSGQARFIMEKDERTVANSLAGTRLIIDPAAPEAAYQAVMAAKNAMTLNEDDLGEMIGQGQEKRCTA